MQEKEFPFSAEFQISIIKLMTMDDAFMLKCASHVKEEFFEDKYLAWAFRAIVAHYQEYNRAPSFQILENEARKHAVDKQTPYFEIIQKILDLKGVDYEYIRKELTGFVRRNIFVDAYKKAANLYNYQNAEGAYEFTKNKMDELLQVDFEDDDVVDFVDSLSFIETAKLESSKNVPTGITPIDQAMNGGLSRGSLTTLLAPTNAGKSMALINFAYYAIISGHKVVTIHHEDEPAPTRMRILSRMTGIPYNKLQCSTIQLSATEKELIKIADIKLHSNWRAKFMFGVDTCVEDVRDWLKLFKKEFEFDLVIDDYGQFINTKQKTEGERFKQSIVYRSLKQIALELNVAMLTCAQGNREAQKVARKGTDYLRSTDLSECFEIARVSNNLITLNRSDEKAKDNRLIFYLEKQRSGIVGVAVECLSDYSRCVTHEAGKMWKANDLSPLLNSDAKVNDNS